MSERDLRESAPSAGLTGGLWALALAAFALGGLAVGLAVAPNWAEQAQLPKRAVFVFAGPLSLALVAAAGLVDPRRTRWGRAGRLVAGLFVIQWLWAVWISPFALSVSSTADVLTEAAAGLTWLLAGLLIFGSSRARGLLIGALVLLAGGAAAVGLAQFAAVNPGRFPFVGPFSGGGDLLVGALEKTGLDVLRQAAIPASLFGHANFGGEFVAVIAPVLAAVVAAAFFGPAPGRGRRWLRYLVGLAGLLLLGLALLYVARSSSRAALLAALAGLGLFSLYVVVERAVRRPLFGSAALHFSLFALCGLAAAGGFWALASSTDYQPRHGQTRTTLARRLASGFDLRNTTVRERLDLWGNGLAIVEDRPVFGVGPGGFGRAYPAWADARREHAPGRLTLRRQPAHPHNELVELAVERGVVGLGLGLAISLLVAGLALVRLRAAVRSGRVEAGFFDAGLTGALLALGLCALVSFPLQHAPTIWLGLVAVAVLARAGSEDRSARPLSRATLLVGLVLAGLVSTLGGARVLAAVGASRDLADAIVVRGQETGAADGVAAARSRSLAELRHLDAAIARRPDDHLLVLAHAEASRRFGRRAEARRGFERALEIHPYLINAWVGLSGLELEAGRLEAARRAARRALALKSDAPAAHLAQARVDAASGFEERAWRGFRSALALEPIGPERLEILVELVAASVRRGDARLGTYFLEQARILAPGHPAVTLAAARVAQRFAPGSGPAQAAWEAVVAGGQESVEAFLQLGIARQSAGRPADALAALDRARRLAPGLPAVLFHRARSLISLNRREEANAELLACARLTARPGGDLVLFERAVSLAASLREEGRRAEGGENR